MHRLRLLLFPFSLIYGGILRLRHWLFDAGVLPSHSFKVPVIAIGNLSLGGTGKTPMAIWLASRLSERHSVAILSRGYGRKSKGFLLVDADGGSEMFGDEPLEMANALQNVQVAVCEDRSEGVRRLLSMDPAPQVIVLDDALQHRKIKPGFRILLTTAQRPFFEDHLLPSGNLRDLKYRAGSVDAAVITKCQGDCSSLVEELRDQLRPGAVAASSSLIYGEPVQVSGSYTPTTSALAVSGIADPSLFFTEAEKHFQQVVELPFGDHHNFTEEEVEGLIRQARAIEASIVTTVKDWMRLRKFNNLKASGIPVIYIPVLPEFVQGGPEILEAIEHFIHSYANN